MRRELHVSPKALAGFTPAQLLGHGHRPDVFRDGGRRRETSGRQDDGELLAAVTGHHVLTFDRLLHFPGNETQHVVAHLVPVRVVERFEVIDVRQDERKHFAALQVFPSIRSSESACGSPAG